MTFVLYFFNLICSVGQSAFSKQFAKNNGNASVFNINKTLSGLVMFVVISAIQGFSFHLPTMLFGIGYGVFLCISMHCGFKALAMGPMAITSVVVSFSLLVPFFFGIFAFDEPISVFGICGIILLLVSIVFINGKKGGEMSRSWLMYTLLTLFANGVCSVIQKYHQIQFPSLHRVSFMLWALCCVFVILSAAMATKKEIHSIRFSLLGALSGIFNSSALYIVLYLSGSENASVLFPIISIINIITVWGVGIIFFKEKFKPLQTVGLLLGAGAVVLLKL